MAGQLIHKRPSERGLTLVELLVVMAVVALIASVVALNAPPVRANARDEADRFAARLNAASEEAILKGVMIGLEPTPEDVRFYTYARGNWSPVDEGALRPLAFSADLSATFDIAGVLEGRNERERDDEDDAPAPTVFFAPTGETTPMTVRFTKNRRLWVVTLNAGGDVTVTNDEE